MSLQVSVVVPTYRRDGLLRACLERLLDQSLDPSQYEAIVCDDGPCDSTRQLVESLKSAAAPALHYLPVTETQGPAAARNRGWEAAQGAIIAFTDDDCQPDVNWLAAGLAALANADAATGRTIVPLPQRPTDHALDTGGLATAEFITANCFVRRAALRAVGGFDERFTAAWREDSDLHYSLLERGFRIVRTGDAIVVHPVRPAPWGVSLKAQRKGLFDPLLRAKHPALYASRIAPFPRLYLVVIAALLFAAVALAAARFELFMLGFFVWLIATSTFAVQRLRSSSRSVSHVAEMLLTSALIPPLSLYWRIVGIMRFGWPARPVSRNSDAVGVTTAQRAL
jgi:glycosyltransferase involved in cell wall biosynthesis